MLPERPPPPPLAIDVTKTKIRTKNETRTRSDGTQLGNAGTRRVGSSGGAWSHSRENGFGPDSRSSPEPTRKGTMSQTTYRIPVHVQGGTSDCRQAFFRTPGA